MIMINITARDFKLTESIEDKVKVELNKIEKFSQREKETNVVLSIKPNGQKAEVLFNLNGKLFKAEGLDENLYVAIESAVETLIKQIRRYVDKKKSNARDSIRFHNEVPKVEAKVSNKSKIVKRKVISAKPMYEQEAILQMDLLNHRSFMFYNADTNTPCMIYKRHDGDYGIIETEVELRDNI